MTQNPDKALRLLGMARRAGRLRMGLTAILEPGAMALLILSGDAGDNVRRNARRLSEERSIPLVTLHQSKEEMGGALGCKACAVAALTDIGLARAIREACTQINPAMPQGAAAPRAEGGHP